jgi:hypothetical protein
MMVVGEEDKSVIQFTDIPQKEIEAEFKHEIYQLLIINEKRLDFILRSYTGH